MRNKFGYQSARREYESLDSTPASNIALPATEKRPPGNNRIKIKRASIFEMILSACVMIMCLGCSNRDNAKIALTEGDPDARRAAVKRMTDPELLAKVALEADDSHVRLEAVYKICDQCLLARIAIEDDTNFVRIQAVYNLTGNFGSHCTVGAREAYVRLEAVKKLTDQALLVRIATEAEDGEVREAAVEELMARTAQQYVAGESEEWRVRLIFDQVIPAFSSVPAEHKARLIADVMPALCVMNYPEIVAEIGEIISIETEWSSLSQSYWGTSGGLMPGEEFACSIRVRNLNEPFSYTWRTSFPEQTFSLGFEPAQVSALGILGEAFGHLSQALLSKLALGDKKEDVRHAAVEGLTDQTILARVAVEEEDSKVRRVAVEKLTDQAALATVAIEDKNEDVRYAAVEKVMDQEMLAKVAVESKYPGIRETAVEKLTDQALLSKKAVEDKDCDVRRAAVKNLTDKALLARIAAEDEDYYVRKDARNRLEELRGTGR